MPVKAHGITIPSTYIKKVATPDSKTQNRKANKAKHMQTTAGMR